jgi:membrane protein CcdC involved in cytochrome C biogenesis
MPLIRTVEYPKSMSIPHAPLIIGILGALAVLAWRVAEGKRAVTAKSIIAPPLGMATGLSMFIVPIFRVPWLWALAAFALGLVVFAYPLLRTSKLTLEGDDVMMRRSSSFFLVIIAIAIIRLVARGYIGAYVTIPQTAALSFLLAFGMIVRWRVSMFLEYKRITTLPRAVPMEPVQR